MRIAGKSLRGAPRVTDRVGPLESRRQPLTSGLLRRHLVGLLVVFPKALFGEDDDIEYIEDFADRLRQEAYMPDDMEYQ